MTSEYIRLPAERALVARARHTLARSLERIAASDEEIYEPTDSRSIERQDDGTRLELRRRLGHG